MKIYSSIFLILFSFSLPSFGSEVSNSYEACRSQKLSTSAKPFCAKPDNLSTSIETFKDDMFFCQTDDFYFLTPSLRVDRKSCAARKSCASSVSNNCLNPSEVLNPKNQTCSLNTNYFQGCVRFSKSDQPERSELVSRLMVDTLSDLSTCFTERYPNPPLAKEVQQLLENGLTIQCSPIEKDSLANPVLMFEVAASADEKKRILNLNNKFFDDLKSQSESFQSLLFGKEGAAHELLHFTAIQNTSSAEHNLGRKSVGTRDRVYACSRLCSKSPTENLTREECKTCLSYPGPIGEVNNCNNLIPSEEFKKFREFLDDSSCPFESTKSECKIALSTKKIKYISDLLTKYPNDGVNRINLLATRRNFKRSLLHQRTEQACALDVQKRKQQLKLIIKDWQSMKKEDALASRSPFDRKPLELPATSTVEAYCNQIPDF